MASSYAQDFGIEKMIFPVENPAKYELNTAIPLYYWVKNFGDSIESREFTIEVDAQGSSPRFTTFRASMPKGFRAPLDYRQQAYYESGFDDIFGMNGVMIMMTPEAAAGDTIEVCITATVKGDINPANDQICFEIVLQENKNRDLVLHILDPQPGAKVTAGWSANFDLSVRNDGSVDYTLDTLYAQGNLIVDGDLVDVFSFRQEMKGGVAIGDSNLATVEIPLSDQFPVGKATFCYRVLWMTEDAVVELFEPVISNNARCVEIEVTPSSIGKIGTMDLEIGNSNGAVMVSGDFGAYDNVTMQLYDLNGKLVASLFSETSNGVVALPYGALTNGMYLFTMQAGGNVLIKEKLWLK